ncbi:hypothetical protein SAMN02927921_02476 [Sinomicrobium oceani]|uniref:Uncharacterized protein n=1 Tax=Sinomicrobium oceani TaxID=1150368 RepID=A0A1K1QCV1_9FLAO|nr:hypothetical protein SAMN02927921_02476 [Sinomicrobium oceani]
MYFGKENETGKQDFLFIGKGSKRKWFSSMRTLLQGKISEMEEEWNYLMASQTTQKIDCQRDVVVNYYGQLF